MQAVAGQADDDDDAEARRQYVSAAAGQADVALSFQFVGRHLASLLRTPVGEMDPRVAAGLALMFSSSILKSVQAHQGIFPERSTLNRRPPSRVEISVTVQEPAAPPPSVEATEGDVPEQAAIVPTVVYPPDGPTDEEFVLASIRSMADDGDV